MKEKDIRIVFMGTPEFAVASLKVLVEEGHNIVAVVTAVDKPAGRGGKLRQSAVKAYAEQQGLSVLQPKNLKAPEFIDELRELNAHLQIVVAFRMLPEIVWDMPPMGTFNLHASLLPQYRGAAPLNRVIMNGEKESGVTTFMLCHEIDTGNILFRERVDIAPDENVGQLHDKLMSIGAGLIVKTIHAIVNGLVTPISQNELLKGSSEIKYAPKIYRGDCKIKWDREGEAIYNHIRGLSPYPGSWTTLVSEEECKSVDMKIFNSSFVRHSHSLAPGTIVNDHKDVLKIMCLDGYLEIKDLQITGKKRMKAGEFMRGFHKICNYNAIT